MKNLRVVYALALLLVFVMPCLATEHAFMAFDVSTQKMYTVVVSNAPIVAEIVYTQENPDGYIGDTQMIVTAPVEVWQEAELSPTDPRRLTDIPDGVTNVIVATVNVYDAAHENLLQTLVVHDTLVADLSGQQAVYDYRQSGCQAVMPDSIRINSSFCAFVCHSSYTIPIVCEDPGYNPDLLEVTVTNGCSNLETHCNQNCSRLDWNEFRWFKRVLPGCHLFLTMTYCNAAPGCVCIWRSDFILPVEMVAGSFRATAGNGRVSLNWATASEAGPNHFVVTRSETRDGVYQGVHTTDGQGTTPTRHDYSWTDTDVDNGQTYYYKLHVVDANGNHVYNENGASVIVTATPDVSPMPTTYSLGNYPNPFNSTTTFAFTLPEAGSVTLKIHDLLGREVATVLNSYKPAGAYEIHWSAAELPAGVYMYTLQSGSFKQTQKMLFLK
jgi:hypothetical protein